MSDPNTPTKEFDPTESVRTLTSAPFKESNMTLREHQDTDKHYIGDSLPVPSLSQMQPGSVETSVGTLPFPSRVDHAHENRVVWGFFNSNYVTIPPGQGFINNLSHTGWGRQMLSSGQVLTFPFSGLYTIHMNMIMSRDAGGLFTNEVNIVNFYNNGGTFKTIWRQSDFDIPSNFYLSLTDIYISSGTNENIQFAVQHNDVSNWSVAMQYLVITRLSSIYSN